MLTNCAALLSPRGPSLALRAIHLVPRLRKLTHMCSRTISGTAYRFRHGSTLCSPTVEKILCRSLFSKRSHIGNLRQIRKQGKGRSPKRKENRRLSFLFAPAAGAATFPPSADGESPAEVQRKTPRPLGANPLTQFVCPGQPVQKKEPPRQGEHADAVRAPRWVGAENPGNPEKIFPPEKAAKTPILTLRKRLSKRYS